MNLKFYSYFFLFLCVFDFLSAETINLPPTSPEKKQINFKCPFACGESGSESIEKIEWKVIQCLYQADKISTFMYKNAENFFNMAAEDVDRPFAPIEPMFFHKPEELLRQHAGRGQKVAGVIGEAGYRERVDFGKNIGYFVDRETGEKIPTTIGIIHYSKKGAHIVPAQPK